MVATSPEASSQLPDSNTTRSDPQPTSEIEKVDKIDFGRQIKPILSDNCFACHGPDEAQRATDFRLDTKESALSDEHSVIVASDVDSSLLVERILSEDPDVVMPPEEHRKRLSAKEKRLLVDWIKQGADWSEHWAFQATTDSAVPDVEASDWTTNYIDNYILSRLESNRIKPSPGAERHTLIRRLSFDLNGLPPTPDRVKAFFAASKTIGLDKAYSQEVDRLLASEHFGERMAVHWLDLVRYADTVGYHGDQNVSVSPYRDYVIDSFNSNMPFDQFTREQLAGDLLESPTQSQQIASGYNRLGMMSAEGGVQPEEYLNKYASDRVRTTASVWLGVTLGCAECHDHKFDAFSTQEFYEFSAFFADIEEKGLYAGSNNTGKWGTSIDVADDDLQEFLQPVDREISEINSGIVLNQRIHSEQRIWEAALTKKHTVWKTLTPDKIVTHPIVKTKTSDDGTILISGKNPATSVYTIVSGIDPRSKAIRLEALPHDSLPQKGPGRASNGNFVVSEIVILRGDQSDHSNSLKDPIENWPSELKSQIVKLANPTATFEQTYGGQSHPDKKWSAASAVDLDVNGETWGWAILPQAGKANELVVQIAEGEETSEKVTIVIFQKHANNTHTLGHFRISESLSKSAAANPSRLLPTAIQILLKEKRENRTQEQAKELANYYLSIAPSYESQRAKLVELKKKRETIIANHTRTTLVTVAKTPREIRVLARGNWMDKSGKLVQPNVPRVLGGLSLQLASVPNQRATRLDLANWITHKSNPLTARVFANRIWKMFFGSGISNVLDDVGSQGEAPSHPELLDKLAIRFVESEWDVKQLVRDIVLSRSYRQSSSLRNDLNEFDPENRLLARQSRFRLDAEFIRDHALAVSDLLVRKTGGRSVMPYQPAGLYRHLNFPTRSYSASTDEDQYRRGLYTHWQRQFLHPAMKTFDAPSREECTAARPQSSTPLAALVLLNDPSYVESAHALAEFAIQASDDDQARFQVIFQRAFSRDPNEEEQKVLVDLLDLHRRHFKHSPIDAKALLSIGQSNKPNPENETNFGEIAAWTSVCRAVINMHEFVLRK